MQARRRIRPRVVGATGWNKCRYLSYIRQPEIAMGPSDSFQSESSAETRSLLWATQSYSPGRFAATRSTWTGTSQLTNFAGSISGRHYAVVASIRSPTCRRSYPGSRSTSIQIRIHHHDALRSIPWCLGPHDRAPVDGRIAVAAEQRLVPCCEGSPRGRSGRSAVLPQRPLRQSGRGPSDPGAVRGCGELPFLAGRRTDVIVTDTPDVEGNTRLHEP